MPDDDPDPNPEPDTPPQGNTPAAPPDKDDKTKDSGPGKKKESDGGKK